MSTRSICLSQHQVTPAPHVSLSQPRRRAQRPADAFQFF